MSRKTWFQSMAIDLDADKQTAKEMIERSSLNWEVEKREVRFEKYNPNGHIYNKIVDGKYVVVRKDTQEGLGVVGNVYRPLQNTEAFSYFDAIVGTKEAKYVAARSFDGGSKVCLVAKLDGNIKLNEDDSLEKYVILNNSHDGSSAVTIQLLALRVICTNGMIGLRSKGIHRVRHTLSMGLNIQNVRQSLGILNEQFDIIGQLSKKMIDTKFTDSQMQGYLETIGMIPVQKAEEAMSARAENLMNAVLFNYRHGKGAVPGTLWGAYNAVTEYLDWNGNRNEKKDKSNLFGNGAIVKRNALEYAQRNA